MRRRLLASYLTLILFVLAILQIPLGIISARRQLGELTTQVERDAVVTATLVEDALEAGGPIDVLTGFRVGDKYFGRPVGVQIAGDGSLLGADHGGNTTLTTMA